MSRLLASLFFILVISVGSGIGADDSKPGTDVAALAAVKAADDLYVLGKYEDAAAKYQAALKASSNLEAAQAGLALAELRLGDTDAALKTVVAGIGSHPDSSQLMAVFGRVQFRRGEMGEAEKAYQSALQIDASNAEAYLGLARLYRSFSLYAHSYAALKKAHELQPKDPDVELLWLQTLPRQDRLPALQAYLAGPHPESSRGHALQHYAEYLQKTRDDPPHACKVVNGIDHAEIKLEYVHNLRMFAGVSSMGTFTAVPNMQHIEGVGLELKANDHSNVLLLDTGASGIILNRKSAARAGLKRISSVEYGGIGDEGERTGYLALADQIKIGPLEFHDCIVTVTDKDVLSESDGQGLMGADVFASYLVDIDLPKKVLKLSPLPKRPGDEQAVPALETEDDSGPDDLHESSGEANGATETYHPKDRYIAPEMKTWTPVFRFGHMLLVPTRLNSSKPMLFLVDTGAFQNMFTTRAARSAGNVDSSGAVIRGASGEVGTVYRLEKVDLQFGRFHQQNTDAYSFDLSAMSNSVGTEVSGTLGFNLLSLLDLKIDYRDGLVDFVYRDSHGVEH